MDPPDESNLFGSLDTARTPEWVARLFSPFGWSVRKCSWTDCEVACDFGELVIERDSGGPRRLLIHGAVADILDNLPKIIEPLAGASVPYSLECYDENRDLIHHARG